MVIAKALFQYSECTTLQRLGFRWPACELEQLAEVTEGHTDVGVVLSEAVLVYFQSAAEERFRLRWSVRSLK
jgi:hypothetical protein